MKILVLTNRVPYPLHDGGNLAVMSLLKGLKAEACDVYLLSMNSSRHFVEEDDIRREFAFLNQVITVPINNDIKISGAFKALLQNQSYHVSRFIDAGFETAILKMLQTTDFDIIQMEGLFVMPYYDLIAANSNAKIVYRQHNIEYQIWEKNARQSRHPLKKIYLKILSKQLYRFEIEQLKKLKYILPISASELKENEYLGTQAVQHWLPYGIDDDAFIEDLPEPDYPLTTVYHLGAMDWLPNIEGIEWFLEKVWLLIYLEHPEVYFYFAGRKMPERFYEMAKKLPNVVCQGEVPDAAAFEKDKDILIVPIFSSSGIRIKIIKAMAQSKAIVTTSQGVQGIAARHDHELLIADHPEDFAAAVIHLLDDRKKFLELKSNAYLWSKKHYKNKELIIALIDFYQKINM